MTVTLAKPRNGHNRDHQVGSTRLIGLAGQARTGKDTAAGFLVERGWTRYAFADEVKAMALDIDPLIGADALYGHQHLAALVDLFGWESAKTRPEVRRFLQRLGTEGIRTRDPDFWVRATMTRATRSDSAAVITDVRFANEADAIRTAGGTVILVERPGLPALAGPNGRHASEHIDFPVDLVLVNDGNLAQLEQRIVQLAYP